MSRLVAFVRSEWLTLLVIGALALAYALLRTPATQIESASAFVESLAQGQPSLLEFYSNS